mgnify:CR=1 FL=1
MRSKLFNLIFFLSFALGEHCAHAQLSLTQDLTGRVVNKTTQKGIPGVKVVVTDVDPILFGITDTSGYYLIKSVELGTHSISFSSIGFERSEWDQINFTSGKQVILNVGLVETNEVLEQVTISTSRNGRPVNLMANVSARSIDISKTLKFPGSIGDISRIVTAYPGVSGPPYASFNFVTVRGNSPSATKHQLNGVEMINSNHLATASGTGGMISVTSMNSLDKFDFYTSAFPAEFFNATGSVFDLKLRNGNLSKYENSIGLSFLGLDLFSEGPLKKKNASYLVNYRYSTFGLIDKLIAINAIPKYQDLTVNLYNQTDKFGQFNLFFVGGLSDYNFNVEYDSTKWENINDRSQRNRGSDIGVLGLKHQIKAGQKSFWNTTISGQLGRNFNYQNYLQDDLTFDKRDSIYHTSYQFDIHTTLNTRFSRRHFNKTGIRLSSKFNNLYAIQYNWLKSDFDTLVNNLVNFNLLSIYSNSKILITDKTYIIAGVNANYNDLENRINIEPRFGLRHMLTPNTQLNFGAGLYSKLEHQLVYYSNYFDNEGLVTISPNLNLESQKSVHTVFGVDHYYSKRVHHKSEVYYQYIYNSPASSISGFSMISNLAYNSPQILDTKSTGWNYGLETTIEGYFDQAYFIVSGTWFDSKYKGGDGIIRNTEANSSYGGNVILGKSFRIGKKKGKTNLIETNISFSGNGGLYYSPVDLEESIKHQRTVHDFSQANSLRRAPTMRVDYSFSFQFNKPKYSGKFFIQIKNLYSNKVVTYDYFDTISQTIKPFTDFGLVPVLGVKFDFR